MGFLPALVRLVCLRRLDFLVLFACAALSVCLLMALAFP